MPCHGIAILHHVSSSYKIPGHTWGRIGQIVLQHLRCWLGGRRDCGAARGGQAGASITAPEERTQLRRGHVGPTGIFIHNVYNDLYIKNVFRHTIYFNTNLLKSSNYYKLLTHYLERFKSDSLFFLCS